MHRMPSSRDICLTKVEQVESFGQSLLAPQLVVGFSLLDDARGLARGAGDPIGRCWPRHWGLREACHTAGYLGRLREIQFPLVSRKRIDDDVRNHVCRAKKTENLPRARPRLGFGRAPPYYRATQVIAAREEDDPE